MTSVAALGKSLIVCGRAFCVYLRNPRLDPNRGRAVPGGELYQFGLLSRISHITRHAQGPARIRGIYKSRGGREEVLQPVILPPLSQHSHPFLGSSKPSPNPTKMDSFFSYFTPSQTTTSGEQQDFPVEFETGGGTSGGGCIIA